VELELFRQTRYLAARSGGTVAATKLYKDPTIHAQATKQEAANFCRHGR
jgi:hypothetical protein